MSGFTADLSATFNLLLAATSKAQVEKCLNLSVAALREPSREELASGLQEVLPLEGHSSKVPLQLAGALCECLEEALAAGSIETLGDFFLQRSPDIDPKLRTLLGKTIQANLLAWSSVSAASRVSLPRLMDHSWAVNQQSASSSVASMNVPSVLVRLKVQGQPENTATIPEVSNLDMELSKESLDTMLEGFAKIRDQLAGLKN